MLGISDKEALGIITINYSIIDTKPSTEQVSRKQTDGEYCANKICNNMQDNSSERQYYTNTNSNANVSMNPMVTISNNHKIILFSSRLK